MDSGDDEENQVNYSSQDHEHDRDEFDDSMMDDRKDEQQQEEEEDYEVEDFQVFAGQTEAERRAIRKEQRTLQKKLEDGDGVDVEEARGQNNKIFKNVRFTREAVLDGDNMNLIATKASHKMDSLIQAPRYDADKVIDALRKKLGGRGGSFNWVKMGEEAGVCFNCIPSGVAFLSGPLEDGQEEIKVKQRAKRQPRPVEDDVEEEKPEDVKGHTERGVDHLSAHENNVKVVLKTLKRTVDSKHKSNKTALTEQYGDDIPDKANKKLKKSAGVCAIKLLYNPKSFTQTVENMFHYSYLVKKGDAVLKVNNEDVKYEGVTLSKAGPIASMVKKNRTEHPPAKQAVVALTMKSWRELIKAYGVEESDVPHRKGSKMKKTAPRAVKNEAAAATKDDSDDEEEE